MAALVITKQTIHDGERNLVVKVHLLGSSTEATAADLITMADYSGAPDNVKIMKIESSLENFHVTLLWEASTDVSFWDIPAGDAKADFTTEGGLVNNAGTGVTGDILITTRGVGVEEGTFVIHMKKRAA